jgi:hypothetical protein
MNIFFTNTNPHKCANEHCDVHQIKMILEYTQLLSCAHHLRGSSKEVLAKTHENHPSAIWVRYSVENYAWLFQCLMQLHKLYSDRTAKVHKLYGMTRTLKYPPELMTCEGFTTPPVAAPRQFKSMVGSVGACVAYQAYLRYKFKEWKSRSKPIKVEFTCRKPYWLGKE